MHYRLLYLFRSEGKERNSDGRDKSLNKMNREKDVRNRKVNDQSSSRIQTNAVELRTRFGSDNRRSEMCRAAARWNDKSQWMNVRWMNEPKVLNNLNDDQWLPYNSRNGPARINATDRIDPSRYHEYKSNKRSDCVFPPSFYEETEQVNRK